MLWCNTGNDISIAPETRKIYLDLDKRSLILAKNEFYIFETRQTTSLEYVSDACKVDASF